MEISVVRKAREQGRKQEQAAYRGCQRVDVTGLVAWVDDPAAAAAAEGADLDGLSRHSGCLLNVPGAVRDRVCYLAAHGSDKGIV